MRMWFLGHLETAKTRRNYSVTGWDFGAELAIEALTLAMFSIH
jgi:hypothetical protein